MSCKSCGNKNVRSSSAICPKCGTINPDDGSGVFLGYVILAVVGGSILWAIHPFLCIAVGCYAAYELFKGD